MMYSPSKEERIIRTLKSGRKLYSYEQRGREGVEKMMNIQTRWMVYSYLPPLLAIGQSLAAMATQSLHTILLEGGTVCPR